MVLTGTAPFKGLRDGSVDEASNLFFGEFVGDCVRVDTCETSTYRCVNETDFLSLSPQVRIETPAGISIRSM